MQFRGYIFLELGHNEKCAKHGCLFSAGCTCTNKKNKKRGAQRLQDPNGCSEPSYYRKLVRPSMIRLAETCMHRGITEATALFNTYISRVLKEFNHEMAGAINLSALQNYAKSFPRKSKII